MQNSFYSRTLNPTVRFIMLVGITLGILQQVTGINAIYFYATSIFKQTGIGTDAAFSSGVLLSFTTVVFTLLAIYLIDRMGRRPLLLVGMSGIAVSLLLCAYSFSQATYELSATEINSFVNIDNYKLAKFQDINYEVMLLSKRHQSCYRKPSLCTQRRGYFGSCD